MDTVINSLQNPKVKAVHKLRKRRERERSNSFLIEGFRELSRAASSHFDIQCLFYSPDLFLGTQEPALIQALQEKGAELFECSKKVFQSLSYRDRPDGLLAIATQEHPKLDSLSSHSTLVVAEGIEKPGNLGTILRSSDAVHADGVIVCDPVTDIYNPNVVRASVGTLFTVPVLQTSTEKTLQWLKSQKIQIVATSPSATLEYTEADLTQKVAIVVGTEQYGLSQRWMDEADLLVRIPMLGIADSLNVATATTLLLYEVLRQRKALRH